MAGKGALIVDPKNVNEISNAIQEILESETKKRELIKLGIENIKRFSWQRTAKQTLDKMLF